MLRGSYMAERHQFVHLVMVGLGLCVFGLSNAADQPQDFRLAAEGYRYEFPRDHGSHDGFRTEWWYYTGNVTTESGRQFGYQLTFFRRAMPAEQIKTLPSKWSITQLYLAHFAVSDLTHGRFYFAEKLSRAGLGKAGSDSNRLHVWIDRWRAESSGSNPDRQILSAANDDFAIELIVAPEKPLVIHGTGGISRKGTEKGQASHYYSFTRLATTGTVTVGGELMAVTGTSWMDHEFGSADLAEDLVGWDWFGLQLTNQTELMLYRLRRADDSAAPVSSGTFIDREGKGHHISINDFALEPISFWTSPGSKARYPQQWRLTIPSKQLSIILIPRMAEQELTTNRSTQVTYWEGAVEAKGTSQGDRLQGRGYMELTGYAERFSKKL